jgi:hypothetical protein
MRANARQCVSHCQALDSLASSQSLAFLARTLARSHSLPAGLALSLPPCRERSGAEGALSQMHTRQNTQHTNNNNTHATRARTLDWTGNQDEDVELHDAPSGADTGGARKRKAADLLEDMQVMVARARASVCRRRGGMTACWSIHMVYTHTP